MSPDEKAILDYMKSWPTSFIAGKEIARKARSKEHYENDRYWAVPVLAGMVTKQWIESDAMGYFKLKSKDEPKKKKPIRRHVSPQILRILKSSGKSFDGLNLEEEPGEVQWSPHKKPKPSAAAPAAGTVGAGAGPAQGDGSVK